MKTYIILILSCISIFGADTSIKITTTAQTNAISGSIFTADVFTRGGQTNLVRNTVTREGVVERQLHYFYHDGVLVGTYSFMPDSLGFVSEAGSPYVVIGNYCPSKGISQTIICTQDRLTVDYFTATNGVYYPADSAALLDAIKTSTELSKHIKQFKK